MSENSTTTTLQLDEEKQILEISDNLINCTVTFTVKTDDIPFEFNIVDQESMENENYSLNKVDNGYVSGTAKNINKPTYLVIRSENSCEAVVTLERTGKKKVTPINVVKSKKKSASASTTSSVPFYKNKVFLILVVLSLLIIGFFIIKKKRKSTASKPTDLKKSVAPISSLLSNDPSVTSSGESFGF